MKNPQQKPAYVKLDRGLHRTLKIMAAKEGKVFQRLVDELVRAGLKHRGAAGGDSVAS